MATRAADWVKQYAALDDASKSRVQSLVAAIQQSGLIADRSYRFTTYPKCLVRAHTVFVTNTITNATICMSMRRYHNFFVSTYVITVRIIIV